jgi:hypothetical protein
VSDERQENTVTVMFKDVTIEDGNGGPRPPGTEIEMDADEARALLARHRGEIVGRERGAGGDDDSDSVAPQFGSADEFAANTPPPSFGLDSLTDDEIKEEARHLEIRIGNKSRATLTREIQDIYDAAAAAAANEER